MYQEHWERKCWEQTGMEDEGSVICPVCEEGDMILTGRAGEMQCGSEFCGVCGTFDGIGNSFTISKAEWQPGETYFAVIFDGSSAVELQIKVQAVEENMVFVTLDGRERVIYVGEIDQLGMLHIDKEWVGVKACVWPFRPVVWDINGNKIIN